jgi:aspartyl-tRNA(Asn)/glutamyl-tRNA(Gln) amidotransferase subunit B
MVAEALIEELRAELPELPETRRRRFIEGYGLSFDDAAQLTDSRNTADYFETAARACGNAKATANWVLNELMREMKSTSTDIGESPVTAESLGEMIKMVDIGRISGKMAKDVLVGCTSRARLRKKQSARWAERRSQMKPRCAFVDQVCGES